MEGSGTAYANCLEGLEPLRRLRLAACPLLETGGLALELPQVVELRATHSVALDDIDLLDDRRVQWEDALDALSETHLADGDRLTNARIVAGQQDSLKDLDALFLAFPDLDVNLDLVARLKLGSRTTCGAPVPLSR